MTGPFVTMIPITKPTLSGFEKYRKHFKSIVESGQLTNGHFVAKFETAVCRYLGIKYCVAVSSCTSGLMLVLKALDLKGEVILPSFTFSASGHALLWNNLKPVFADILSDTYTIDPAKVEKLITSRTSAILATHVFGNPCQAEKLEAIAKKRKLKIVFDSAHAFGSRYHGRKVGFFGDVEVFSCSPTKLLTAAEGGLIVTNNKKIADFCRIGRNYGDDGTYDTKFHGLSARMSELHAVVGLESLKNLDKAVKQRNSIASYYKKQLFKIDPNLIFQRLIPTATTTYKDFSILINPAVCGYHRDDLHKFLNKCGIVTKKYFYPSLHRQRAYREFARNYDQKLPITKMVSENILCLPLFSHISKKEIDFILNNIKEFYGRNKKS